MQILVSVKGQESTVYKLHYCSEFEASMQLVFRNQGSARSATFMGAYEEVAIKLPDSKWVLSWANIETVDLYISEDVNGGVLEVHYTRGDSERAQKDQITFGEIDWNCWRKLKEKFGGSLRFLEHSGV